MSWKIFRRFNDVGSAVEAAASLARDSLSDAAEKKAVAVEKYQRASQLEEELHEMDRRNHYSQGLTQAIRGRYSS